MSLFRSHRTLLSHSSRQLLITNRHFPSYLKMSFRDYSNIETPASCYVDFCLVPVSISIYINLMKKHADSFGLRQTGWNRQRIRRQRGCRGAKNFESQRVEVHDALGWYYCWLVSLATFLLPASIQNLSSLDSLFIVLYLEDSKQLTNNPSLSQQKQKDPGTK